MTPDVKKKSRIKKLVATAAMVTIVGISGLVGTQITKIPTDNGKPVIIQTVDKPTLSQDYEVLRVVDGDTFEITYENAKTKVRMIGIDTPETVKAGTSVKFYGKEASDFTKKELEGKKVKLEFDKSPKDVYNRLLAYVYLPNGEMINIILLNRGYAKASKVYPNIKYSKMFTEIETKAQEQQLGMWNEIAKLDWEKAHPTSN